MVTAVSPRTATSISSYSNAVPAIRPLDACASHSSRPTTLSVATLRSLNSGAISDAQACMSPASHPSIHAR